ncbi:TonB-dependent receptor [Novosphingobium sp. FSY-8]|uniref:TonB-dependent receptor n=1 Tax=Novosphingobium ovatum TaxID=1908523 RepID=A0ABW9XEY7_9SPHN|nr:TonB-dependent receptor [Novosphingobium ovatum]NBC37109.1 TonB-dependent receptor [Novosphingobium ovatum]
MRRFATVLLAASALMPIAAHAEAAEAPAAGADISATDAIVVIGRGEARQAQTITARDIAIMIPGVSPMKAIEALPSVNFQSADPFGSYEWAQRVSIRGFNQNQLGFTLDGVPLGDASYGNLNGLHISRAIITDNLGATRVSQGAGNLGAQATNNLGGTVEFASMDPASRTGIDTAATYGSWSAKRLFVRANIAADSGARGFVAYAYQNTDKWKGYGQQRQHMVNAKGVLPLGGAELTGYFSFSDRAEVDYQDMSLEMLGRLGYRWDNVSGDYAYAVRLADIGANNGYTGAVSTNPSAGTAWPSPITNGDDAYYSGGGLRRDYLGYVGLKAPIGTFTASIKGYYHANNGRGLWWTPYVNSPNGVPMALRTTEYAIKRGGAFGTINGEIGAHKLEVGGWIESNAFNQARRFYAVASRTDPGQGLLDWPSNPFYTQWEYAFHTDTFQYHVEDSIRLGGVTVNLGWKGFQVINRSAPIVQGSQATGRISSTDWFQPHVGLTYKVGAHGEAFASFSQSTRAFVAAATGSSPFATTQAGFAYLQGRLKPENSDTYEAGYRFADGRLNGTVGAYLVNFHNRLLGLSTGAGIIGNPTVLQNVGSVRSMGIEALLSAKLGGGFTATGSYAYNDSTYRNNVVTSTGAVIATAGKTTVDTPRHTARAEMAYDSTTWFGRIAGNYMSKRYFTYTNGLRSDSDGLGYVGGRLLIDLALGYKVATNFTPKPIELQLNIANLFDRQYIASIGTNGFGSVGDNQTMMVGTPRTIMASVKAGF